MKTLAYIKARLNERSTWAGLTAAILGGAGLQSPYSWLAIAVGALGAIVPTGGQ